MGRIPLMNERQKRTPSANFASSTPMHKYKARHGDSQVHIFPASSIEQIPQSTSSLAHT